MLSRFGNTKIIFALLVAAGLFLYFAIGKMYQPIPPPKTALPVPVKKVDQSETSGWKALQSPDGRYEFRYPADKLKVARENSKINLSHAVPLDHEDPCDMRDGAKRLKTLTDFNVSFHFIDKDLKGAVASAEPEFFRQDYLAGETLSLTPGYIDEARFGTISGYKITNSAEGCGEYVYYFPLEPKTTLRVSRIIVAEFQPILLNYREYLEVPGIIEPAEADRIFKEVVGSLKILNGANSQ